MNTMNQSDFRVICTKAGYDLTDSELLRLRSGFEDACMVIQPLYQMDLADTEMVLKFYPLVRIDK